jgi:hypothetical protein
MATGVALVVYALAAGAAAVLVWRRPVLALYLWVVGLASHNLAMALLRAAGAPRMVFAGRRLGMRRSAARRWLPPPARTRARPGWPSPADPTCNCRASMRDVPRRQSLLLARTHALGLAGLPIDPIEL